MKPELEIVNVVGSGELPFDGLNLEQLAEDIDAEVKEHEGSGKDFVFENGGLTLYDSGKYIIRAANEELVYATHNGLLDELLDLDLPIGIRDDIKFEICNFVGHGKLNRSVDLIKLSIAFGLENTEYETEQFPALISREYDVVTLIYGNGNVILPGASTKEELERVFSELVADIEDISERIGL